MNTIGWLSQQENLISIRPKDPDDRRITLTATQQSNITLAVAAHHPGLHFRHGRLHLVAETLNARPAIHDCAARRPGRLGAYIYFVASKKSDTGAEAAKAARSSRRSTPTRSTK